MQMLRRDVKVLDQVDHNSAVLRFLGGKKTVIFNFVDPDIG
jgi:hypothetical protein